MSEFLKCRSRRSAAAPKSSISGWLGRFWAEQHGSMSYLAVAGAMTMMVFGGVGIDMMHAELKRNKVQNTLDRAVLAAADMDNALDPNLVVSDYFRAMGMESALVSVEAESTLLTKRVSADGYQTMPSNFMGLLGIDTMQAKGTATAENAAKAIEISLVLDVSGSMKGTKLEQLKTAAKSFIDTMLPEGGDETVTINIVPYSATVNLGNTLSGLFPLEGTHDYSHCALFDDSQFTTTSIDLSSPLEQLSHFDLYASADGSDAARDGWCPTGDQLSIVAQSSDPDLLKARVDSFVAAGNTAIDMGFKWGVALLDPAARPVVSELISTGLVNPSAAGRPYDFGSSDRQKYVVVMTDGENTSQFELRQDRQSGMSNVWLDTRGTETPDDDRFSIRLRDNPGDDNDVFIWSAEGTNQSTIQFSNGIFSGLVNGAISVSATAGNILSGVGGILGDGDGDANDASLEGCSDGDPSTYCDTSAYSGPVQLTWPQVFANMKLRRYANTYYWRAYQNGKVSYNEYRDAFYMYEEIVGPDKADSRLSQICSSAKEQDVVVYAIGVEAPERGLAAMQDCASSPSHYFDVAGSELNDVFSSIARTMTVLRLTQ